MGFNVRCARFAAPDPQFSKVSSENQIWTTPRYGCHFQSFLYKSVRYRYKKWGVKSVFGNYCGSQEKFWYRPSLASIEIWVKSYTPNYSPENVLSKEYIKLCSNLWWWVITTWEWMLNSAPKPCFPFFACKCTNHLQSSKAYSHIFRFCRSC